MAQKVVLVDDLDGSVGAETISYAVDGRAYEIDLSADNATAFRTALAPYIDKSRAVDASAPARRGRNSSAHRTRNDLATIRSWAKERGLPVSDKGRIKQEFIDQYDAEHSRRA